MMSLPVLNNPPFLPEAPSTAASTTGPRLEVALTGMTCAACVRRVEKAVLATPGVTGAEVNLPLSRARISFDGNGLINGDWDASSGVETVRFWQHLRLANLMTGSTDTDDAGFLPRNALGGRLGVQRGNSVLGVPGSLVVCSDAIPGKLVRQLDIALDDGDPARGSLRAGTTGATGLVAISAANPLDDANSHTVCASL